MPTWTESLSWGIYQLNLLIKTPLALVFARGFYFTYREQANGKKKETLESFWWGISPKNNNP